MEKKLKTGFEVLKESNIEKKKDVIAFKHDEKIYDLSSLVIDKKKLHLSQLMIMTLLIFFVTVLLI